MSTPISFRPTAAQALWLAAKAQDGCLSRNALIRLALEAYMAAHPAK